LAYSRRHLSASTSGQPIAVAATATPGTAIHGATGETGDFDEVYLWVSNVTTAAATLTIEWGGTTDPTHHMVKALSIPANSPPIPIVTGCVVSDGVIVRAFSGTASALNITGYVNRIEQ
jgi:hypothetical protein